MALVGPVSAMKTPIMSTVAKPLRGIDTDMARENQTRDGRVQQAVERGKAAEGAAEQPRLGCRTPPSRRHRRS